MSTERSQTRRAGSALAAAAAAVLGCAGAPGQQPKPLSANAGPAAAAATTRAVTLSFELLDERIYIPVQVQGSANQRFIVDTGGSDTLTTELAARLGLPQRNPDTIQGAGEAPEKMWETGPVTLAVGSVSLSDPTLIALPGRVLQTPTGVVDVAGMLGAEFLGRLRVRIRYPERELTLSPDPLPIPPHAVALPFDLKEGVPVVSGSYAGQTGRFLIDTGDRSALTLLGPFWRTHQLAAPAGATQGVTGWGVGGPIRAVLRKGGELRLGAQPAGEPLTRLSLQTKGAFADPTLAGTVGAGVLRQFDLLFDYPGKTLYLSPASRVAADVDRGGAWLLAKDGGVWVSGLLIPGPAHEAGLREGDRLIALGGLQASTGRLPQLRAVLRGPAGTVVEALVERGGRVQPPVQLRLRDPVH